MIKIVCGLILLVIVNLNFEEQTFTQPYHWPKPLYQFKNNKLTKEKILLGRVLFYDPILSKDSSISCNSCHSPFSAFTHVDHALSHGIHDSIGTRNSLTLMNLAWQKHFMWDGAINNLDMQSLAPISHPAEMASNMNEVVVKLNRNKLYKKLFQNAFKDTVATGEHTLKAIAQFMLTIVSCNAKYDRVMNNEEKFTQQELNGYQTFKKNCSSCHTEPLFTNGAFANNGLAIDTLLNDKGRMSVTQKKADAYKFKVPTLRNIEFSYPYMHDGRFKKLNDVLNHYTNDIIKTETLDSILQQRIVLTSNEKVDLIAFLLTLSDKKFLFDAQFAYPKEVFNH
jgi:cytochrome c peroxidase